MKPQGGTDGTKGMQGGKTRGTPRVSTRPKCAAKARSNNHEPCKNPAGFKTDHVGTGRCLFHGGRTPIKHGLFSKVVPTKCKAAYEARLNSDADPKDLRDHLALIDTVVIPGALQHKRKSVMDRTGVELQALALDIRGKLTKRMHDMEEQNKIKFTEASLEILIVEVVSVVSEYVDAATLRKISTRIGIGSVQTQAV